MVSFILKGQLFGTGEVEKGVDLRLKGVPFPLDAQYPLVLLFSE